MPRRGDESVNPLHFAEDDDDAEIGGFTRGKRSYDEDEDEDGGWALNEDHSARLWDSADDVDDEDADEEGATVAESDAEEEEEETDLFGASPVRGRRGRPKGSGKKQEQPSVFSDAADIFSDAPTPPAVSASPRQPVSAGKLSTPSISPPVRASGGASATTRSSGSAVSSSSRPARKAAKTSGGKSAGKKSPGKKPAQAGKAAGKKPGAGKSGGKKRASSKMAAKKGKAAAKSGGKKSGRRR